MPKGTKVLAIATNSNPVIRNKRTGLWLSELTHFLDVITAAGYEYDLASPAGGVVPLDEKSVTPSQLADPANVRCMADSTFRASLAESTACADIEPEAYGAIYLSGGHGTMWDFRQSADLQTVITRMYDAGAWMTAVCHGVSGFVDARDGAGELIVRGRRVTGFTNLEDMLARSKSSMPFLLEDALKERGAKFEKRLMPFTPHVQVDGKLITGQNPQSARAVGEHLVARLQR